MTSWKFGNYDLASFGVITLIDDHLDLPDRRGNDQIIPMRHGTVFVQKYYDARVLMFGLAVAGQTPSEMESVLESLRGVLAVRAQQTLSQILADGSIRTAQACVNKSMQITRPAPNIALLTIEFTLAEPFFRASSAIPDNTVTVNASPKAWTVTNPGTIEERDPTIILTGPLANTAITNSTNGCILSYNAAIASPRVVTIQTVNGEFIATDDLGANKIGNVTHSGASALMVFDIGTNTLSITDDTATTGTVKATFNTPYL